MLLKDGIDPLVGETLAKANTDVQEKVDNAVQYGMLSNFYVVYIVEEIR